MLIVWYVDAQKQSYDFDGKLRYSRGVHGYPPLYILGNTYLLKYWY